jgi:BirA family biotin operon repressor/biotin-[acetyl-CoA-carboxylase] ligase
MDIHAWTNRLAELPLGELFLYQELGSTNQLAEELLHQGVPNLSLVLADSQTAGKGRSGRSWVTNPGTSLAFSLIIYPDQDLLEKKELERVSGLGALAVAEVLNEKTGLKAEIKWPNDVLVGGKKVSGVLVDLNWSGKDLKAIVIGIGLNVHRGSVPAEPLNFPATSLEESGVKHPSRLDLAVDILEAMLRWYPRISTPEFLTAWGANLAYQGQEVKLVVNDHLIEKGRLMGLSPEGALLILTAAGEERIFRTGEIQLRLVDRT